MKEILVALITGGLALIGVVLTGTKANRDIDAKLERQQAVTATKLDELTREVRLHNNFAQRVPVMEEKLKSLSDRVYNLEKSNGH